MKKNYRKLFAVAAIMLLAGAVMVGGALLASGGSIESLVPSALKGTEIPRELKYDAAGIERIEISVSSQEIYVMTAETQEISLKYTDIEDKAHLETSLEGGVLTLEWKTDSWCMFGDIEPIYMWIPSDYAGALNAETSSGSIELTDVTASAITLSSSSGSVATRGANADKLSADTSSGSITITESTANDMSFTSSSGGIALSGATADSMYLDTASGEIRVSGGSADAVTAESTSGSVRFGDVKIQKLTAMTVSGRIAFEGTDAVELILSSTSGEIAGTLAGKEESYAIMTNTTSGESNLINIRGGERSITADTTSGDIELYFAE